MDGSYSHICTEKKEEDMFTCYGYSYQNYVNCTQK